MRVVFLSIFIMIFIMPVPVPAAEFHDSTVRISLFGGPGIADGDIMRHEKDKYYITVIYGDGMAEEGKPNYSAYHYGIYTDISIFDIGEKMIMAGLRGMYAVNRVGQEIKTGGGIYKERTRKAAFMKYQSASAGPVVSLLPGRIARGEEESWYGNIYINIFFLGGPIFRAKLYPVPIAREQDPALDGIPESAGFSGWQYNAGIGIGLFVGFINAGVDIYYSHDSIETDKKIYPGLGKKSAMAETRFDLSLGVSI